MMTYDQWLALGEDPNDLCDRCHRPVEYDDEGNAHCPTRNCRPAVVLVQRGGGPGQSLSDDFVDDQIPF